MILGAWLLVIAGITSLLVAANSKTKEHVCGEILIGIRGNEGKLYVEKQDVLEMIEKTMAGELLGRPLLQFNLALLERNLEKNPWIRNAELYFDSKDALHVFVEEREPIARVFTTRGSSFYMDSSGARMPLLEKMSIRVPVITGLTAATRLNQSDSAFLDEVKAVAYFVFSNEFWNAQVGQIDITADRRFELIPVIGDHVIRLGDGKDAAEKLNRLFVFYKQVMSKVGFHKYATLDVQFTGQVVAIRKEPTSPVDSIQLQKNIQELMDRANMQNIDEDMLPAAGLMVKTDSIATGINAQHHPVSTKTDSNPITVFRQTNQNAAKKQTQTRSIPRKIMSPPKPKSQPKTSVKKPKAVMGELNEY